MAQEKQKPASKPTRYRVLLDPEWLGEAETHGARAAALEVAKHPGKYVVVPVSNWTEVTLAFEEPPPPKLAVVGGEQTSIPVDDEEPVEVTREQIEALAASASPVETAAVVRNIRADEDLASRGSEGGAA